MRKGSMGFMEEIVETENLARLIYQRLGYTVSESASSDYMQQSQHPMEISCYLAAQEIIGRYFK
jgi:hypothetical protein